jgi:hypothetical protein
MSIITTSTIMTMIMIMKAMTTIIDRRPAAFVEKAASGRPFCLSGPLLFPFLSRHSVIPAKAGISV